MPHAIGEEGIFAELARVKRERDEARAALRRLMGVADHAYACDGGINCYCGLTVALLKAETALLPEKTEGK